MPTTCAELGCHNRQSKQCGLRFYGFLMNKDPCCSCIMFVSIRNPDVNPGSPVQTTVCVQIALHPERNLIYLALQILYHQSRQRSWNYQGAQPVVIIFIVVLSTIDAVSECKNYRVRNWTGIDRQLNWSKHSEMDIQHAITHDTLMHPAQYLVKGI